MIEKIMAYLESLPTEDLLNIRKNLDELIRSKFDVDLGKRKGKRAKVKIQPNSVSFHPSFLSGSLNTLKA